MKICVIVPMYNEQHIAKFSLTTIMGYVRQLPDAFTVVVINDGSKDNTGGILREMLLEYTPDQYRIITHLVNKGYGAALKTGISFAVENNYDYVFFMDSDLTNHPKYIEKFYEKMIQGYDYIKASRYIYGGGMSGVPWQRRIISLIGNKIAKMLFDIPLNDLTNGFRAVKTSILSKINLTENSFAIIMQELCLVKPFVHSYAEIPYILTSRNKNFGRSKFTYDFKIYFSYLKYAIESLTKTEA